jgi:hypothetical protein
MKNLIFLVLLFLCVNLMAQKKTESIIVKASDKGSSSFYFNDLDYNADGTIKIYGRLYRAGALSVKKAGEKKEVDGGTMGIPSAVTYTVKSNQVSNEQVYINLQSLEWLTDMKDMEYRAVDPKTKEQFATHADKNWPEVAQLMPRSFQSVKKETESFYNYVLEPSLFGTTLREVVTKYSFDPIRNKLVAQKPEQNPVKLKMPEADGKYNFDVYYLKDNKRKMVVTVAQILKKGEGKFYGMQNRKFVTLNGAGEVLSSFDYQTTFPRSLMFAGPLGMSATDTLSTFEDGGIFVFGRVLGGGKSNDPDPLNYDYVITGPAGQLVSKGTFKFGAEKRDLEPVYAYKKDDKIYLLAKGVGKDTPGYAVLTFDQNGLIGTKEYASDKLKAATFGPYDKGITTNYGRLLQVTNHINLGDGGALICGESYEDITPVGASFTDPKVREYYSQVFLQLDKDGTIVKNYVLEKTDKETRKLYTKQNLLSDKSNKFFFASEERLQSTVYPILTVVDLNAGSAQRISLKTDDVYNVDNAVVYKHYPDLNKVIFLGRSADKDNYFLNGVVYLLE